MPKAERFPPVLNPAPQAIQNLVAKCNRFADALLAYDRSLAGQPAEIAQSPANRAILGALMDAWRNCTEDAELLKEAIFFTGGGEGWDQFGEEEYRLIEGKTLRALLSVCLDDSDTLRGICGPETCLDDGQFPEMILWTAGTPPRRVAWWVNHEATCENEWYNGCMQRMRLEDELQAFNDHGTGDSIDTTALWANHHWVETVVVGTRWPTLAHASPERDDSELGENLRDYARHVENSLDALRSQRLRDGRGWRTLTIPWLEIPYDEFGSRICDIGDPFAEALRIEALTGWRLPAGGNPLVLCREYRAFNDLIKQRTGKSRDFTQYAQQLGLPGGPAGAAVKPIANSDGDAGSDQSSVESPPKASSRDNPESIIPDAGKCAAPSTDKIPVNWRTRPLSLAEAGVLMGLAPKAGTKKRRRNAATQAMKLRIAKGQLESEPFGSKWVFDKRRFPASAQDKL